MGSILSNILQMVKQRLTGKVVGKRGASTVIILKTFGLAMAAFVIVTMVVYWNSVRENTFLEKNYLARDIALLLTAASASPGDLAYCYYTVGRYRSLGFSYEIGSSRVVVEDSGGGKASYFYAETLEKGADKPRLSVKGDSEEWKKRGLAVFVVTKTSKGIEIEAKGLGENAAPCSA